MNFIKFLIKQRNKKIRKNSEVKNKGRARGLSSAICEQITGFKLWDARNHLLFNFPSLRSLSLATVSKILKKQIGMSYKKLGELNPKKTTSEHTSNLSLWIQKILELFKLGCHVIFADEFLIDRNTMSTYGWAKRGIPGLIKRNIQ